MELLVPADMPDGPATLGWGLSFAGGASTSTSVTVTGGLPAAGPGTACTATTGALPCGPGMELGREYATTVYTHCGLREIVADGQRWVPEAKSDGTPPAGYGDPLDTGNVVLVKPGVLEYRTDSDGAPSTLRPRTPSDPVLTPCK